MDVRSSNKTSRQQRLHESTTPTISPSKNFKGPKHRKGHLHNSLEESEEAALLLYFSGKLAMSPASVSEEAKRNLLKEIKTHETAIKELNQLSSSRAVYQKSGNIYFRTSIQKATTSEQKNVDSANAKLQKLNSA